MKTLTLLTLTCCLQLTADCCAQSALQSTTPTAQSDSQISELKTQTLPIMELKEKVSSGEYIPIPRSRLNELAAIARLAPEPESIRERPPIRQAEYTAELKGTRLESGKLTLQLYDDKTASARGPLPIGTTNLQDLSLRDQTGPLQMASDSTRRLFLVKSSVPSVLNGAWSANGQVAGDVVSFLLELPTSTTSRLILTTPSDIQVTAAGSLVMGPVAEAEQLKWTLIPGDPGRFRFSCRKQQVLSAQAQLSLTSFSSTHTVAADLLTSRWTFQLPATAEPGFNLISRLSPFARVTDVSLDDERPVEWSVRQENGQSLLSLVLPDSSESASLTVTATSVLPQRDTWDIPMLSPVQWTNIDGSRRGPLVMPIGQINVLLPAVIELEEWILIGIQERDVLTRPDQSREYQLVQYLPEASAAVRTSTSPPRLTDSVVTVVEPAGRFATVRCMIHVSCQDSSVVELKWPIASEWQVIAARQVSDGRSLFFEFPEATAEATAIDLTVHLPNTLEAGSSGLFELQLQQTDSADARTLRPPILRNPSTDRFISVVVFPTTFSLNSDLQRRWSEGRRQLSLDELQQQLSWLPSDRITSDMKSYDVTNTDTAIASPVSEAVSETSIRVEYAAQLTSGLLTEVTQTELPSSDEAVGTFLLPEEIDGDMRWTVDGEPVAARRDPDHVAGTPFCRWILPPGTIRSGRRTVVRCETRRTIASETREFNAAVAVPETDQPVLGNITLTETDFGVLSSKQLIPNSANPSQDPRTSSWILPSPNTLIKLQLDQTPRIQQGQTIDVQMLHLIEERGGSLHHEILAVASVSQLGGRSSLPLSLPPSLRPLVLVNGHQVLLTENEDELFVPLPANATEAQILLTWTTPEKKSSSLTGTRFLPRLFHNELSEPQCTHHLLIDPLLDVSAPTCEFASTEQTDILPIVSRVIRASSQIASANDMSMTTPLEVRHFVTRWQLASSRIWSSRTLIDTTTSEAPIEIEVTRMRRRLAVFTGVFLMLIGGSLALRSFLNRYRLAFAFCAVVLLGFSFLAETQVQTEILRGAFWGLTGGLFLVLLSRWQGLRFWVKQRWLPGLRTLLPSLFVGLLFLTSSHYSTAAQAPESLMPPEESSAATPPAVGINNSATNPERSINDAKPEILIPEDSIPEIVFARRDLVELMQARQNEVSANQSSAVLSSTHSQISADSSGSVEVLLRLNVVIASSSRDAQIRIPLLGALLEDCRIDNLPVAPKPDGEDAIVLSIPNHMTLEPQSLRNEKTTPASGFADASGLTEFETHTIECRLRPVTVRQPAGIQFRMPSLPCPSSTAVVEAAPGSFTRVRAKSSFGTHQWSPADGQQSLSGLAADDGIEVRLLQSGIERGSPQDAAVSTLIIGETLGGQYQLTCIAKFESWNPLTPEVRYRLPNNYELQSVSVSIGPDMVDLLWSVNDQNVIIQLPDGLSEEFLLALQFRPLTPNSPLEQVIPAAELQQFADCTVNDSLLLAVAPNPVFSVLPLEGQQIVTASFAELQTSWGQWIRRTDTVFRVPRTNTTCTVRLVPRECHNDVRIDQSVSVRDSEIQWSCRFDVETTLLPVFRHRLTIDPSIVVLDVTVVAGEANRLASWHRRGDQLTIQLREGTINQHQISITARRLVRPDDVLLTLSTLRLQNAQILESAMTIVDNEGLGLIFEKLDGAVPDLQIEQGSVLLPETPVRLQIVGEQDSVVLKRLRPVEPTGTIVAIRSGDQINFLTRITRWSGTLGPLHLGFPGDEQFIEEPFVVLDSQKMPLTKEADEFTAGQDIVKTLFDRSEFIVSWTVPLKADSKNESAMFNWPRLFDGIRWDNILLIPLDAEPGSSEELAGTTTLPDWLKEAGGLTSGHDLTAIKARLLQLPLDKHLSGQSLIVPVRKAPDRPLPEKTRNLFAVSDSTVWAQPNHSAVGDTQIVIFASRYPERCSLRMPPGTVVTELDSSSPARWQTTGREQLTVEINSPITTLRARWMSERAAGTLTKLSVQIGPPYPFECEFRQTLTVYSSTGDQPILTSADSISTDSFLSALAENVQAGLNHARPVAEPTTTTSNTTTLPLEQSILDLFEQTRSQFLTGTGVKDVTDFSPAHCKLLSTAPMIVEINREADWTTVAALFMGASIILIATFARLLNSLPFRLLPRRSTNLPVAPSGPATVVHTASVRSAHSGSQSRPPSALPSIPRTSPDKPGSSVDVRSMDPSTG